MPSMTDNRNTILDALNRGKMTQRELINELGMSVRTLRYLLNRMETEGIISRKPNLQDIRAPFYQVEEVS